MSDTDTDKNCPQVGDTVVMKGKLYKIRKIENGKAHLDEVSTGEYTQ